MLIFNRAVLTNALSYVSLFTYYLLVMVYLTQWYFQSKRSLLTSPVVGLKCKLFLRLTRQERRWVLFLWEPNVLGEFHCNMPIRLMYFLCTSRNFEWMMEGQGSKSCGSVHCGQWISKQMVWQTEQSRPLYLPPWWLAGQVVCSVLTGSFPRLSICTYFFLRVSSHSSQ